MIIASLARQLSSLEPGTPLLDDAVQEFKKREDEAFASGHMDLEESVELINNLRDHYPTTTIVIDALDECDPERRGDFLEALESILKNSTNLVKIFISSRDDKDIVDHLRNYPNLSISSDKNTQDIQIFTLAEVDRLVKVGRLLRDSLDKEGLKKLITEKIMDGAGGM